MYDDRVTNVYETEGMTDAEKWNYYNNKRREYNSLMPIKLNKFDVIDFMQAVEAPPIKTGFDNLDNALDGGLREGLYVLGAVPSLGKTTFALQMADQIAQQGYDVLIYSLEMTRIRLTARSISRLTYELDPENAKALNSVIGDKSNYSEQDRKLLQKATDTYNVFGRNLYISDIMMHINLFRSEGRRGTRAKVSDIVNDVNNHIWTTGRRPIVFIDYLQYIAPEFEGMNEKQKIDNSVEELKVLGLVQKIPVIAISSFNRAAYNGTADMTSFKESGDIEYSADVLFGFQLQGMNELPNLKNDEERKQRIKELRDVDVRKVELLLLKNREGGRDATLLYDYTPKYNHFRATEVSEDYAAQNAPKRIR